MQITDEYVRIGYRVPRGQDTYASLLPDLVENQVRAHFEALRDTFRLYGVKADIAPPTAIRPMRTVKPMPPEIWDAAENRLAALRGEEQPRAPASPLVETVRRLLKTMGYECEAPLGDDNGLTCFRCVPAEEGLLSPLVVGCREGPAEMADVSTVASHLQSTEQHGHVIAERRVLQSARDAARTSERVQVFTLSGYYNKLLGFRPYIEGLVDDYTRSELARTYVDLGCVRYSYDAEGQVIGDDSYKPMDEYVDAWLRERGAERNHISILGDYGTGKTSFCQQYAAKQGRRWLADPDRERIPILINLREYTKTLDISNLITGALVNQYGIRGATYGAFDRFNADGKLLILFDGFDEMAQRTGMRTAVDNFWELAQVVVPGSKVVLTCRTPYFCTHRDVERLFQGRERCDPEGEPAAAWETLPEGGYIDLRDRPNFEVLHLQAFSDEDIQTVLRKRFPEQWESYWAQIQRIYNLYDLAKRPVLLDMIARTLPELHEGQRVNAARLYQVYTDLWLERDVAKGRTLVTPADRRLFAEELAIEMLDRNELSIHFTRIPQRVQAHFELTDATQIDYFEADVRTCAFLGRDQEGNYSFAHKSFMEFFCACRLHRLMLEDMATAHGPVSINEEVRLFLTDLFADRPKEEPGPPREPPEGCAWVPPGEFVLGGKNGFDMQIVRLEGGFFCARTPATHAQYARFIEEQGYATRDYWTDEGWQWKEGKKRTHPGYWEQDRFGEPDQPVVGVTWYEAAAYCRWLASRTGQPCRLPTEKQWEKAARGYDGREYPWGAWKEGVCNTSESSIGKPSPVGQFSPQGDSPYGLQDAAGNVWEWMASEEGSSRVVRGGSWSNDPDFARCAVRVRFNPGVGWDVFGFRVVVSPIS